MQGCRGLGQLRRRLGLSGECGDRAAGGRGCSPVHLSRWLHGSVMLHSEEPGCRGHHFCGMRRKWSSLASAQSSWGHQAGLRSPQWPKSASSARGPAGQSTGGGSCCPGKFISTSGHLVAIGGGRTEAGGQERDLRSASAEPSEGEREQVQARSAGQCQPLGSKPSHGPAGRPESAQGC